MELYYEELYYCIYILIRNRYEWETSQQTFVAQFRWEDGARALHGAFFVSSAWEWRRYELGFPTAKT